MLYAPARDAYRRDRLSSPYPPDFAGNPISYGYALFSLTLIASLSLASLMHLVFEARAQAAAWKLSEVERPKPLPFATPLTLFRVIIASFMLSFFLGTAPDVVRLSLYGEANMSTLHNIDTVDRICDGLASTPFLIGCVMLAWGSQVMPQQLVKETRVLISRPNWRTVKDQLRIAGVTLLIAAGVTIAKASAGA